MIWLHASPRSDLHIAGIDPSAPPLVSRRVQGWVYLGSREYLFEQYFIYAPKRSRYFIYEVDIEGLPIDDTPLAGEQIRTGRFIEASRVKLLEEVSQVGR